MNISNQTEWLNSVEHFKTFSASGKLQLEERDYKEKLIETLGRILSDESINAVNFAQNLLAAVKKCNSAVCNLTHFTLADDFYKYLSAVSDERLRDVMRILFDESMSLAERFDWFQEEIDSDYEKHVGEKKHIRWLTSIFLTARFPEKYIFYRSSIVKDAAARFGIEILKGATNGETYANYIDFMNKLRERLEQELNQPVSLVDAHSFLWSEYRRNKPEETDWREKLKEWLKTNSKTIPPDLAALRDEFNRRFPKEKISEMTLEQYALGTGNKDSFCNWLEFKTKSLASMGGFSSKFGVWKSGGEWKFNQTFQSPEDALDKIKDGLLRLISVAEADRFDDLENVNLAEFGKDRNGLRAKTLALYFPKELLALVNKTHIKDFLKIFEVEPRNEDIFALIRQLLKTLRQYPEFEGFDTQQMMMFLYESFPRVKSNKIEDADKLTSSTDMKTEEINVPPEIAPLMNIARHTKNILLYGPPGTGKTWLVNHFTNYYLLYHNVSPEAANHYWESKDNVADIRKSLLTKIRAAEETSEQPYFWWITANEKEWTWEKLFEAGEWFFSRRRLAKNYPKARAGDYIFCYLAHPHKKIVALARVKEEMHLREKDGKEVEGILIEPIAKLSQTISWKEISENHILRESELVRNRAQGTLFALTGDEAKEMAEMLKNAGNEINLPFEPQNNFAEFVTFHQSFTYEEFVEGLRPVLTDENAYSEDGTSNIGYQISPGIFRQICKKTENAWREKGTRAPQYILVIDEINRANIAKVLGELITLIEDDKRLGAPNEITVKLPVSGTTFGVPPNLLILGTMNTADRSIALLDLALRRRFTFQEMMPDYSILGEIEGVDLGKLLQNINRRITLLLDRDHQIGHSYLMNINSADDLHFAWYHRIIPLLKEYFYNDGERLRAVLGEDFVKQLEVTDTMSNIAGDSFDFDALKFNIVELTAGELINALMTLSGFSAGKQDIN